MRTKSMVILLFVMGFTSTLVTLWQWDNFSTFLKVCNLIIGFGLMYQAFRDMKKLNESRSDEQK